MNRLANGRTLPGTSVVAADAIAAIAGVPLGSVTKVLLAIHAIDNTTVFGVNTLLEADAVPLASADGERYDATERWLVDVSHKIKTRPELREIDRELKISKRFP